MKSVLLSIVLLICCPWSYAQEAIRPAEHLTRERTYHVDHYRLAVNVDPHTKTCFGETSIKLVLLRPMISELKFDAADLHVRRVTLGNTELEFHTIDETLSVTLDKIYGFNDTLTVNIAYSVTAPKKGLYFTAPDSGYADKQLQAWTQGEPEDNHFWFPCYDFPNDKATSEMIVTVADNFTAISNGTLLNVKKDLESHTATYHWYESKPHASYLISLIVGTYVEVKDSWGTVPLSYYVYPHQKNDAMRSFSNTPKMMEFYSGKIGYAYPWEKYAQTVVQDFIYGGEENVSATTLTDGTIHDSRAHLDYNSDGLVAHELAHMWWGDLLTCRDWSHAWLNEGFATFFENQFTEYHLGKDDGAKENADNQLSVRNADAGRHRRPTVCDRYIHPMDLFDSHIYAKGAVTLNMLKDVLGDELFWKAVNYYVHKFAFQNVETNDFKIAVEEATGYNLSWFFDEWLYKAGYPEFQVASNWDRSTNMLNLNVRQTQTIDSLTGIFTMPVNIEFWVNNAPEVHRVWVSQKEQTFSFPAYQQPQNIIFDKGSRVLKKIDFQKSRDEWIYQLLHAEDGVDRSAAIDELSWIADSEKVTEALKKAAIDDPFWDVRRNAVWALGDAKKTDVSDVLVMAYGDRDARVRIAAVTSLGNCRGDRVIKTLQHAFEGDSSFGVAAAALKSLVQVDSLNRKSYCKKALTQSSFHEIIRSTALQLLAQVGDEDALGTVYAHTQYGIDRNIRIQSINLLVSKWGDREDVISRLMTMVDDPSIHVRRAIVAALGNTHNPRVLQTLQSIVEHEPDARTVSEAREAIEKIQQTQSDKNH